MPMEEEKIMHSKAIPRPTDNDGDSNRNEHKKQREKRSNRKE